jgi:molecular chaperone DnaK
MPSTIDYGIDLGTTNSSIACCRGGEVRVFQSNEQMSVTPSVVYVSKTGRMLVGRKAYDNWVQDPRNTQAEFKRWMGYNDRLAFPASGKNMSAEELSAEVLKALRADVSRATQEDVRAAVITVPAAFGTLQCDATGRAATMAGFEQAPLLQEPIAAAIAYGAAPDSRNQRWMVFDLGGGTLDIAVVSTRNGRLAVLEHQGDNRLGGKDIDRLIAEGCFFEPLKAAFNLPDRLSDPQAYDRLFRHLVRHAEQAKIVLSSAPQTVVELFDIGDDKDGKPLELTLTLTRADMESKIRPLVDKCLELATRALEGARLSKADLDRTLLVGGPTQMPVIREALLSGIGAKLDTSLDPMTVVTRGAALYASTLELTVAPAASAGLAAPKTVAPGTVHVELSFERASGTLQSPVAGVVAPGSAVHEVKIDAEGGFWTSGWLPLAGGCFQADVMLSDRKPLTKYKLIGRDRSGRELVLDPAEFAITHMLPMAAPPLPHTIAIELSTDKGVTQWDAVFKRHCPLPAETRKTYRAEHTLRPSEMDQTLPIKFWEIEVSDDPQEKWWAGCVHVRAEKLKRPLLEGSEIELTIKIDPSRKMTVEVFLPLLNQSFVEGVFVPDPPSARSQLQQQLDLCFERLDHVRRMIYEQDRDEFRERAEMLQLRCESIFEQVSEDEKRGNTDPDAALAPTDSLRKIRTQLCQIEEQMESGGESALARKVRSNARWTQEIVDLYGTELDKAEFSRIQKQLEKYLIAQDVRGLKWVEQEIIPVWWRILQEKEWYWRNAFDLCKRVDRRYINQAEAQVWIARGEEARAQSNVTELRKCVCRLWELTAPDQVKMAQEQAAQTGLRGS